METAIKVNSLTKIYKIYDKPVDRMKEALHPLRRQYHRDFYALRDVSFEIKRGERIGVIGKNGSGKSTLLKILTGVLTPSAGEVTINGRISALLELGAGFHPEYTGMENIFLQGSIMGYNKKEMEEKVDGILAFADIGEFIHQPVKSYSSGMFVRLAFGIATIVEPEILIIDEALAVGDVFFRQKCFNRMDELKQRNTSIILVTHSMNEIRQFCSKALLLDHGQTLFWGNSDEAVQRYLFMEQDSKMDVKPNTMGKESKNLPKNKTDKKASAVYESGKLDWPEDENAFFSLDSQQEIIMNGAVCTAIALCDMQGKPCRMFSQGASGVFYYEFELLQDIDIPIGGILLFNEKNILVHGKNSMQYDIQMPSENKKGSKVRFRQEIKFSLAGGEYTFSLGLSSIDEDTFQNRSNVHYSELDKKRTNLCYAGNIGSFSIAVCLGNGITEWPYHGICDLPGKITFGMIRTR